jgi:hypothetical protein
MKPKALNMLLIYSLSYVSLIIMKIKTFSFLAILLVSNLAFAQEKPVKMSNSGICHAPNTTYYEQTKNFTPFKTLDECLKAGGRMPKK